MDTVQTETEHDKATMRQYLTFQHAGEGYALGVSRVREIIGFDTITRVPKAPAAVRGVINLRGAVVPVLDLAVGFGAGPSAISRRTCIVVVETSGSGSSTVLGLLADSVNEVIERSASQVQALPSFGTRAPIEYLEGIARVGDGFVLILDIDRAVAGALSGARIAEPTEVGTPGGMS